MSLVSSAARRGYTAFKNQESKAGKVGIVFLAVILTVVSLPLLVAGGIGWLIGKIPTIRRDVRFGAPLVMLVGVGFAWHFLGGGIFGSYWDMSWAIFHWAKGGFGEWPRETFDWIGLVFPALVGGFSFSWSAIKHRHGSDKQKERKEVGGSTLARDKKELSVLLTRSNRSEKNRPLLGFPVWNWKPGYQSVFEQVKSKPEGSLAYEKAIQKAEKALSKRTGLFAEEEGNGIVIGAEGSGKTTGILVPLVVEDAYKTANLVVSSVKDDIYARTAALRSTYGKVMIYDPLGTIPGGDHFRVKWSPIDSCRNWRSAQRVAASFISQAGVSKGNHGEYFAAQAATALGPMLYAAFLSGTKLDGLMQWLSAFQHNPLDPTLPSILRKAADSGIRDALPALYAWEMVVGNKSQNTASQPFQTINSAMNAYRLMEVLDYANTADDDETVFRPEEFVRGKGQTLYLVVPDAEQNILKPVLVALLTEIEHAAVAYAREAGGRLPEKLVFILDEMAVAAPIPQLPGLLATCRSRNISVWTGWQDLSQVRQIYEHEAQTVMNNSRSKVFLSGASDRETLSYISYLGGKVEVEKVSTSTQLDGEGGSESKSVAAEDLLPAEVARQLAKGTGLLFYANLKPVVIDLPTFFLYGPLRREGTPDAPPPPPPVPQGPPPGSNGPQPITPSGTPTVRIEPENFNETMARVDERIQAAKANAGTSGVQQQTENPENRMLFDW